MHLQIPQTQVGGSELTLGILGTEWGCKDGENNRVQFILRVSNEVGTDYLAEEIRQTLNVYGKISVSSQEEESIVLFSLVVVGELRNPQKFVESIARKVSKASNKAFTRAFLEYANSDDHS